VRILSRVYKIRRYEGWKLDLNSSVTIQTLQIQLSHNCNGISLIEKFCYPERVATDPLLSYQVGKSSIDSLVQLI
jgi:hypothetical protein